MLRLSCKQFAMAYIKGRQIKKAVYNINEIAKYVNLPYKPDEPEELFVNRYLQNLAQKDSYREKELVKITNDFEKFAAANSAARIIEFTKDKIAGKYQKMTPQAQVSIDDLVRALVNLCRGYFKQTKFKREEVNQTIVDALTTISQFFILTSLSKEDCMNFLDLMSYVKNFRSKLMTSEYFHNTRICIENLVQFPITAFTPAEVYTIINGLASSNIKVLHYSRAVEIFMYFWQTVDSKWYLDAQKRFRTILSLKGIEFYSDSILDKVEYILMHESMYETQFLETMSYLITCGRITADNYKTKYKDLFAKMDKKVDACITNDRLSSLINAMYRALIWHPPFWRAFMEKYTKHEAINYENRYHAYCIFKTMMLFRENLDPKLLALSQELYQKIDANTLKQQHDSTNYMMGMSCQTQMANAFRILNKGNVRNEVQLDIFSVDIMINDNFVIEVNGNTHYITNVETGEKKLNLKSIFRTKYLQKMGYHVVNIMLEDYNEGSFDIVQTIIVELDRVNKQNQEKSASSALLN